MKKKIDLQPCLGHSNVECILYVLTDVYLHIIHVINAFLLYKPGTWMNIREKDTGFILSTLQFEKELEQIIAMTSFLMH